MTQSMRADRHGERINEDAEPAKILQPNLPETHVRGAGQSPGCNPHLFSFDMKKKKIAKQTADWIPHAGHIQHGVLVGNRVLLRRGDQMILKRVHRVAVLCPQIQLLHEDADGQKT